MNGEDLFEFVEEISAVSRFKVEEDFGGGFVRLNISEAEKRQAKHDIRSVEDVVIELIRNSRDSGCKNIFLSSSKEGDERTIVVIDDGCGIPNELINLVFEPRVTSKLDTVVEDKYGIHGRGMALYSIKNNVKISEIISSAPSRGTLFKVAADIRKLPEKRDQSTQPITRMKNGAIVVIKGPNNISRVLTEFALTHTDLSIYFGAPSQILATLYDLSQNLISERGAQELLFYEVFRKGSIPLWQCLGAIGDPKSLMDAAGCSYGLNVSLRNVHRIFSGEIEPLLDIRTSLYIKHKLERHPANLDVSLCNNRNLARYIDQSDLSMLSNKLKAEFETISEKYFLKILGLPKVKRENNQLKFILELAEDDDE